MEFARRAGSTKYMMPKVHRWAQQLGLEIPDHRRGRFSAQEKRVIVQEAIRNGISLTCRAY